MKIRKCKCGCGEALKSKNSKYRPGHFPRSSRTREKMSGSSHPMYGKHHTKETIKKMSKSLSGKHHSEETKRKISKSKIGGRHSKEVRKRISISLSGRHLSKDTKKKMSENLKSCWRDSDYQEKMRKLRGLKPNKSEQKLDALLQELTFGEYKYVGDFQFFLGGKNPDFMNVNGQKKLIELFGNHWHNKKKFPKRQTPEQRIKYFLKYGFDTLILWESELKHNRNQVIDKILLFNYANFSGKELIF